MTAVAEAIKKVATGPHLSKNLSIDEARTALTEILSGEADPVQAAILFIALRMKTETNEENLGILQALQANTKQTTVNIDNLMIISDPFNGFNRHCPVMAFLPAVLAACGLPALSQGVKEMGPKFGVTHSQVLSYAGYATDLSIDDATAKINDPTIAWAFLDQAQATPSLFALQDLRTRMIKRPSLATLEKMIMPIRATGKTHLQIGFVHKAYPTVLAWLSHQTGFNSALIVRGIEGGVLPTLREISNCFRALGEQIEPCEIEPSEFGLAQTTRGVLPNKNEHVTAEETVELAMQALKGQTGTTFDSLVLGAAMALWHCELFASQRQAADHVRQVLKSGQALTFFKRGLV